MQTVVGGNTNYKEWVTSNFLPAKDRLWRQHDSSYKNTAKAGKERWKKSETEGGKGEGRREKGGGRREGMRKMG